MNLQSLEPDAVDSQVSMLELRDLTELWTSGSKSTPPLQAQAFPCGYKV